MFPTKGKDATVEVPTEESLYQRLGGYDAIAAATDRLRDCKVIHSLVITGRRKQ